MPRSQYAVLFTLGILLLFFSAGGYFVTMSFAFASAPRPTPQYAAAQDSSLRLERVDIAQCRDDNGDPSDFYWTVIHVTNTDQNHWVKGTVFADFVNSAGEDQRTFIDNGFRFAAGAAGYIIYPDTLAKRSALGMSGKGFARVELRYAHVNGPSSLVWTERDGSEKPYQWDAQIISHTATTAVYPRHSLDLRVMNTGTDTMYRTTALAAVLNSSGKLVDIAWSETPGNWPTGVDVSAGGSTVLHLKSIAQTGRCLGAGDPAGYQADYWINTLTPTGQPLTSHYTIAHLPTLVANPTSGASTTPTESVPLPPGTMASTPWASPSSAAPATLKPTPSPTRVPTSTPKPATATSTPCPVQPKGAWEQLWVLHQVELGCPLQQRPVALYDAEEPFQNGHMFWRSDLDMYYVVYDGGGAMQGSWNPYDNRFGVGATCSESAPAGLYKPTRGFGIVWCGLGGANAPIGWATDIERGIDPSWGIHASVQDFTQGVLFQDSDGMRRGLVYVFLYAGRFVRTSP
jgi:hypothetical protein